MSEWISIHDECPKKEDVLLVYGFTPHCHCFPRIGTVLAKWNNKKNKFELLNEFSCALAISKYKDIGKSETEPPRENE